MRGVVVIGDFVGVVAEREEQAIRAARALRVRWRPLPPLPSLDNPAEAIAQAPAQRRLLLEEGDVESVQGQPGTTTLTRSYVWPYQMHGSIKPSCVPSRTIGTARIKRIKWSGTQNPQTLRYDLSRLVERAEADIDVVRMEASGCYGRNCADDVAGDALLLSRAMGQPVRVQLSPRRRTSMGAQGHRAGRRRDRHRIQQRRHAGLFVRIPLSIERRAHARPSAHRRDARGATRL